MIGKVLLAATRFLVGGHARWQGCAPSPAQRIYFANHSSHLDTVILWAALPEDLRKTTHPVAAQDYWGKGRVRRLDGTARLGRPGIGDAGDDPPCGGVGHVEGAPFVGGPPGAADQVGLAQDGGEVGHGVGPFAGVTRPAPRARRPAGAGARRGCR